MTDVDTCPHCGGEAVVGTTCPRAVPCPTCEAPAGTRCRRPSGHLADQLHAPRVRWAETIDERNGIHAPDYL